MTRYASLLPLAVFVIFTVSQAGNAQAPKDAPSVAEQRRDDLAHVAEMVADPDPLQRLANMEGIITTHDAQKIQIAIKSAFASDDAQVRGLAMDAYMASLKQIVLQLHMSPALQQQYDSLEDDETQQRSFEDAHRGVSLLRAKKFQLFLIIQDFGLNSNHGTDTVDGSAGDFVVTGDRFLQKISVNGFGDCIIELRPTKSITLEGSAKCDYTPKLTVTAELF